ncbi:MAG TPA: nucleotidyltransferase domain-containing protein [Candidatus Nanoarchaeia archaeon]|nr:nucleotidyltransferase domain-containing protein [Candidatus Nanoarchaeia archaeon]
MISEEQKIYKYLNIGEYIPKYRIDKMNIVTKEYAIDSVFIKKPWKRLTFNEICKLSGKKSSSYVYRALHRLQKERIIESERVGKSILYNLNWNSLNTQIYIGFLEEYNAWSSKHVPLEIISKLSNLAMKITPFFVLLVTGSYAKKKQTPRSDLDVVIICDNSVDPRSITAELNMESQLSMPPVHLFTFTRKQFTEMLLNDEENYGKEFARHHLIFVGGTAYYSMLKETITHGFKG